MGLFDLFRRNQPQQLPTDITNPQHEIPKEVFIEESEPQDSSKSLNGNGELKGIDAIYAFLQADYETKGYSDALLNPDDSYRIDNTKLIRLDLIILIQKVNTYYNDLLRELDFHIGSRSRAGLIDLVEELKTRKEMVLEHMEKVKEISKETDTDMGMPQRIVLSYQRGFMRGMSAISQSNVLNKNL